MTVGSCFLLYALKFKYPLLSKIVQGMCIFHAAAKSIEQNFPQNKKNGSGGERATIHVIAQGLKFCTHNSQMPFIPKMAFRRIFANSITSLFLFMLVSGMVCSFA